MRKVVHEQRVILDKERGVETDKRTEFLAVEWHTCVHSNEFNLTRDLSLVTLPGIKFLRDIANEIFIDIVVSKLFVLMFYRP